MANWVADFEASHRGAEVVTRARHALHVRGGDQMVAYITGGPIHYRDGAEWKPIDTTLRLIGSEYGAPHSPVRIGPDGQVRLEGQAYTHLTRRVGLWNTQTQRFNGAFTLLGGRPNGDRLLRSFGSKAQLEIILTEAGLREELTLFDPSIVPTGGDWECMALETQLSLPLADGEVGVWNVGPHRFQAPTVRDARSHWAPLKRLFKNGCLYTLIPLDWLSKASYPVVVDPDFTSLAADGIVHGENGTYATARSTSYSVGTGGATAGLGQLTGYECNRVFLKFNTSSIGSLATVLQVNLKGVIAADYTDTDTDIDIVKQDWSAQDPLSDSNRETAYDNCLGGTLDSAIWLNTAGKSTNTQYTSGNLSTAWVSKTGNTYYSLITARERAGTTPTGLEFITFCMSEHATPGYRPVLTVVYAVAGRFFNAPLDGLGQFYRSIG